MLLCALGLARDGNYVGLDFARYSAVREDGNGVKLYDGDAGMMTDPTPITPGPPVDEQPGNNDDSGDILLPEVP